VFHRFYRGAVNQSTGFALFVPRLLRQGYPCDGKATKGLLQARGTMLQIGNTYYIETKMRFFPFMAIALVTLGLSACSGVETKAEYPTSRQPGDADATYNNQRQSIFGTGGLSLFSSKKKKEVETGITVNAYLWRASLDTISFMPIDQADPFGGTILTEWFQPPQNPYERVKVNVFIIGRQLRTDALKLTLFRQIAQDGQWIDVAVDPATVTQLEETILTRARQLKVGEKNTK